MKKIEAIIRRPFKRRRARRAAWGWICAPGLTVTEVGKRDSKKSTPGAEYNIELYLREKLYDSFAKQKKLRKQFQLLYSTSKTGMEMERYSFPLLKKLLESALKNPASPARIVPKF